MINFEAFFKISYGLYIVSSGSQDEPAGFIANAAFQVTAEPARFAVCCNKDNHSAAVILKTGAFALSVLHRDASADIIGTFGYKSGKDTRKFDNVKTITGQTGVPVVLQDCMAFFEFKLEQFFEVGTHYIFIGELVHSELLDATAEPLTYDYYRNVKKGMAPKNAPTYIDKSKLNTTPEQPVSETTENTGSAYKCNVCGYIYSEEQEGDFDKLPYDWTCPICGVTSEDFTLL